MVRSWHYYYFLSLGLCLSEEVDNQECCGSLAKTREIFPVSHGGLSNTEICIFHLFGKYIFQNILFIYLREREHVWAGGGAEETEGQADSPLSGSWTWGSIPGP